MWVFAERNINEQKETNVGFFYRFFADLVENPLTFQTQMHIMDEINMIEVRSPSVTLPKQQAGEEGKGPSPRFRRPA